MPERILLGKDNAGTFCLKVSRKGDEVRSPNNPLLFDSSKSGWSGQVYSGGNANSTTSINWSATKGQMSIGGANVVPLIVAVDSQRGRYRVLGAAAHGGTDTRNVSNASTFQSTATTLEPVQFAAKNPSTSIVSESMGQGRTSTNLKFFVLKMPCAYGYMTSTYMTPGTS